MHQSVVEVGTSRLPNIKEAREEFNELRRQMIRLARENGLRLAPAATHPFADWRVQEIYPDERYKNIVEDMQLVARANLIFGLHVHVGVEDRETAIHLMNQRPLFSPAPAGALAPTRPSGWAWTPACKSYRCKVFDKFPRTNIPDYFPSWGEYRKLRQAAGPAPTASITRKKIWWDIRPHPVLHRRSNSASATCPCALEETIAIAALIQATVAKLYQAARARTRGSAITAARC